MQCIWMSGDEWELSDNMMRVLIDKKWIAATFTASAFALIGPDAGYAGVCAQAEICAPKLSFRKMCLCCVNS